MFLFPMANAAFIESDYMIIGWVTLFKIYPALWWATNESTSTQFVSTGKEHQLNL